MLTAIIHFGLILPQLSSTVRNIVLFCYVEDNEEDKENIVKLL